MARPAPYSYSDAGFNGFFRRTLSSNPVVTTLRNSQGQSRQLNFDDVQTSGSLGDLIKVGLVTINGKLGRISVHDEEGNEVTRIGELDG